MLKADAQFLDYWGLIDYSLLLGIEHTESTFMNAGKVKTNIYASEISELNVQKVYHFGIIDYLQEYNVRKKFERLIKSMGK
jgi:hypothetical protein